jgi:hypothetical protein
MILTKDFQADATRLKYEVEERIFNRLKELPASLASFIKNKCILSGGCFASILHGVPPKDYDFWCLDDADLPLLQQMMDVYDGKIVTANATTLKNGIQLIKLSHYAIAKQSFDFEHCRVSYIPANTTLYMSKTQYNSIINMKLVPTRTVDMSNPSVARRVAKFTERGWRA